MLKKTDFESKINLEQLIIRLPGDGDEQGNTYQEMFPKKLYCFKSIKSLRIVSNGKGPYGFQIDPTELPNLEKIQFCYHKVIQKGSSHRNFSIAR
jgi:hypothetical protein